MGDPWIAQRPLSGAYPKGSAGPGTVSQDDHRECPVTSSSSRSPTTAMRCLVVGSESWLVLLEVGALQFRIQRLEVAFVVDVAIRRGIPTVRQ